MGSFLESEKTRLVGCKADSLCLSTSACSHGLYKGKLRPFCLPTDLAEENLFPPIRELALRYFDRHAIKWHDGQEGKPSNHLCDSQVCCVNFLFPFADRPAALSRLLCLVFPSIRRMLPIEDGGYVAFEWIGEENYLGERVPVSGRRTRGANCTSADCAVMFERADGKRQIVLIEWKYTESYSGTSLAVSDSGTDRTAIYRHLLDRLDCPLCKELLPGFDSLFFEPFYQFMRQQFLAHEMERAAEMEADVVSLLHIAPRHNVDFQKVTSPQLAHLGSTSTSVWGKLVDAEGRFLSVTTEELFGSFLAQRLPEMQDYAAYISARYPWVSQPQADLQ